MASLKDINATIEEGNEDLEKLNQNFTKWFESQKKGGDDLESAAEARTKKGKSVSSRSNYPLDLVLLFLKWQKKMVCQNI